MKIKNLWDLIVDTAVGRWKGLKDQTSFMQTEQRKMAAYKSNLAYTARYDMQEIVLEADMQEPTDEMQLGEEAWVIKIFSASQHESGTITLRIPRDKKKPLELSETKEVTQLICRNYATQTDD